MRPAWLADPDTAPRGYWLSRAPESFWLQRRRDPTQTVTIQRRYTAEGNRRWRRVERAIRARLDERALNQMELGTFRTWLGRTIRAEVVDGGAWQEKYASTAYNRGLAMARTNLKRAGYVFDGQDLPPFQVRQQTAHIQRFTAELLGQQTDLRRIAAEAEAQIFREVQAAVRAGEPMDVVFARAQDRIDKIGKLRTKQLAETRTVGAHAEATLQRFQDAGAQHVVPLSEIRTAGDRRVCSECQALEQGNPYTIAEASGILPVHVGCRCAWFPLSAEESAALLPRAA